MAAVGRPSTAAGVASLYEGLIDGDGRRRGDPDPPPAGVPTPALPTLMAGRRGPRPGSRATVLDFAAGPGGAMKRHRDPPGEALRRRQAAARHGHRRRAAAPRSSTRCSRTSSRRSARRGCVERTIVVSGEPAAHARSAEAAGAERDRGPRRRRPLRGGAARDRRAPASTGAACVVLLPGDCPLLDPRELDRLLTGGARALRRRSCPTATAPAPTRWCSRPPTRSAPPSGEGSCERHVAAAREAGIPFAVERLALARPRPRHPGRHRSP